MHLPSTTSEPSDAILKAMGRLLSPEFLRGFSVQTMQNFRKGKDHILEKNTAKGTIVLNPGFTCHPSTLQVLAECLKGMLGEEFNIIFVDPATRPGLNNVDTIEKGGIGLYANLQKIHSDHEKNGNMILVGHSIAGPLIIRSILESTASRVQGITQRSLPDTMGIHMIAPPLGNVPLAHLPLSYIFPALIDLRKKQIFTAAEITTFLEEIGSLVIHQTMVDSLVPHVNQDLKGMYPDMPQELLQKVEQVVYPDFNHLTGVNGKGVGILTTSIANQIRQRSK